MKMENIEKIRFFLGTKAPRPVYFVCVFFRIIYKNIRMPQHKKRFGNLNPDKTFFIIRLFPPATGFLANYNYVLGYMHYAIKKDWIPVIDMENYGTLYQEADRINGTKNVWEYYFEQPFDVKTGRRYSLSEVYRSANVILSNGSMELTTFDYQSDSINWQREMMALIPFNNKCMNYVNKVYNNTIPPNCKLIGVSIRGSDVKKRVIGHPIPISVEEIIPILKQHKKDWNDLGNNTAFFVKSEEQSTINSVRDSLCNVYYSDSVRIDDYNGENNSINVVYGRKSKYKATLDYLTDIYILSKCDALVGTMNNGLYTALLWNKNQYNHIDIIDKGRYR